MSDGGHPEVLRIRKYPNRRYYDATRSRHVTLHEVYDLVRSGQDVRITDSRTNSDITNHVLLQIVLENDEFKLDLLPSWILHLAMRSNPQVLRSSLERFFGSFMETFSATQQQFDAYSRQAVSGRLVSGTDRTGTLKPAFAPSRQEASEDRTELEQPPGNRRHRENVLEDLRRQIAELRQRIERLSSDSRDADG